MSEVAADGIRTRPMDPYEIGWYIESSDEGIYGPASRKTLGELLREGTITPNTLVRHCTHPEASPVADQAEVAKIGIPMDASQGGVGDDLDEAWPRSKRERRELAEDTLPCAWHKKAAILMCVRCHAPYCGSCRAKPTRKQFFLCRRCQVGMHNRRFVALIVDTALLVYLPLIVATIVLSATGMAQEDSSTLILTGIQLLCVAMLFVRDSMFGGAGPGKRLMGLRVVKSEDGKSPLSHKQGCIRWLSQFIPIFNLADAIAPYYDPLLRRYGDRWAGTRVLDTDKKLAAARQRIGERLFKKGIRIPPKFGMSMKALARTV